MKTADQKIAELIKRHAFLSYSNYKYHSTSIDNVIDRIEQEYIILTGYQIQDNPEHEKLLEYYSNELNKEKVNIK